MHNSISQLAKSIAVAMFFLYFTVTASASDFHNALSLQGFTGILNTPSAYVTEEGKLYALYSNQEESQWRNKIRHQDNYMISIGMFSNIELGGRFIEAPGAARDLSFNGKVRIPHIPENGLFPQLALGVQDISGGKNANLLKTWYGVASKDLWRFRFSAGYGTGPGRMDGLFGGVELKACDWFYLLADHDTRETNVGARAVTPQIFGYPANLQLTAKTSMDYRPGNFEIAVALQIPLGNEHKSSAPLPPDLAPPASDRETTDALPETAVLSGNGQQRHNSLLRLHKKLAESGFQNLVIGVKDKSTLVVELENSRYFQNEIDGMGVAAGIVARLAPEGISEVRLISKKHDIRMLQIAAPLEKLRRFYREASVLEDLSRFLSVTDNIPDYDNLERLDAGSNDSLLHASLMLYPGLKTYLGTEIGAFDYLLSLKPELNINAWKGAALSARWDIPIVWSENFDDNGFFRSNRDSSRIERLMLFQAIKPAPGFMAQLGAGMVQHDIYGTINEALWFPAGERHRLRVMQGYGEDRDHNSLSAWLGEYRYYYPPLDTYLTATAGKFWSQDTGIVLEAKRFFGDTALTAYFKSSEAAVDKRNHQAVGVQFSLPLTFRQEMLPYPVQVRGSEEWSYAQESEIAKKGSWNYIGTTIGTKAETSYNLTRVFYNRDRLSEEYIRRNLLRMRDAYINYGE